MSRITITESELLSEIKRLTAVDEDAPPDAMTVTELAQEAGVSNSLILRYITSLKSQGRVKAYRVNRYDAQGRPHRATAYVLLPDEKPKRKRA